ncbi:MAG: hypothetical protein RIB60_07585 [Phycisphaerales bacterium]
MAGSRYASNTSVPIAKSKAEIETMLVKYGATGVGYATDGDRAGVMFRVTHEGMGLSVRIMLDLPSRDSKEFMFTPARRYRRNEEEQYKAWEQACRSRWRALTLVIKAKLEAIECGISTIEREFLPDVLLPDGSTVGHFIEENREALLIAGSRPLLPGGDA